MHAMSVPTMDPTKAEADPIRSRVIMLRHCLPGPTKKHVAATAEMLPSVNMKMKLFLQQRLCKVASAWLAQANARPPALPQVTGTVTTRKAGML